MNTTNIYIEIEQHPYGVGIIVLLFLFMIGIITTFFVNVSRGVKVVGKSVYYLTAPVHMTLRWAYKSIRGTSWY
jgi:hypothetical protein